MSSRIERRVLYYIFFLNFSTYEQNLESEIVRHIFESFRHFPLHNTVSYFPSQINAVPGLHCSIVISQQLLMITKSRQVLNLQYPLPDTFIFIWYFNYNFKSSLSNYTFFFILRGESMVQISSYILFRYLSL